MPIDAANIPKLIKASKEKKLEAWKLDYFARIRNSLQVHTKGQLFTKVVSLFPNEHPDSQAHCLATYEPITKSSIWKGINNLNRIFSNSSFTINVGETLTDWLEYYTHGGVNLLTSFLNMWVDKAVAEDPNGLMVVYPPDYAEEKDMCVLQFVRSEFIISSGKLDDGTEYVAFISEHDSTMQYTSENVVTKTETFFDPLVDGLNSRTYTEQTYNQRIKAKPQVPVMHVMTRDGLLVFQVDGNTEGRYTVYQFQDTLSLLPAFPAGGNVADEADEPLFESFVAPFIPFGNLALIQHRNHRAVDLQFSYPRMREIQSPCDQCNGGKRKVKTSAKNPTGVVNCEFCKGSGFVTVQSPYKSYLQRYDPSDEGENKHLAYDPVKFYAPEVGIITYSKDAWKNYLKMGEEAIFITQKVQTGQVQSAESKSWDIEDLYSWLLKVSTTFYNNMRMTLQCLEDYVARAPITVSVEKPYSFAILTEEEAFLALGSILTGDAPVFVKGNQVDNFVSKFVSKNSPVTRSLGILKQFDPLLFYSLNEVQSYKATGAITQEMVTNHVLAYPMLLKLYEQDKNLFEEETTVIIDKLTQEIAALKVPTAGASLRSTLLNTFNNTNTPAA